MKIYRVLFMLAALVSACSSTPSTAPRAVVPQPVSPPSGYAPMVVPPAAVIPTIPEWYVRPPASTPEHVYVIGTSTSRDLSMSGQKAQLDAETHLANMIAAVMNTMSKDYRNDSNDAYSQSTEIVSNKIANDVKLTGGTVVKRTIYPEGGGFRTYVLMDFPLGASNPLRSYLGHQSDINSQQAAERELNNRTADYRARKEAEPKPTPTYDPEKHAGPIDNTVSPISNDQAGIVIHGVPATPESGPLNMPDDPKEEN